MTIIAGETMRLASSDPTAPHPVLTGVQAEGRLDGVLFELTVRQTYRNRSARLLEVVYTFPLPAQAVLLGFASTLNGERHEGAVVACAEGERRYEQGLADGDAPVMLEAAGGGLHSANIGNLKPGDEIVLELRYAQLLAFDGGRLRVAIPTTIAPRYGNPAAAGLQPQQVPEVSLTTEYPLALAVTVGGALSRAALECPTHRCTRSAVDGGVRLALQPGAWLDRDVVFVVTPAEPHPSLVVQAEDTRSPAAPFVTLAAFQPARSAQREAVALELLADCSGSMGGDSIDSARRALHGVINGVSASDRVGLSRFGSTVERSHRATACGDEQRALLRHAVDRLDADLGGTEMAAALGTVFDSAGGGTDVLLITDGETWDVGPTIDAARRSGHRVFAIGVGASPAESVLRDLAEATGGACEFATPGEALEDAALRMLKRIRQPGFGEIGVDWAAPPVWQVVPKVAFAGDTVLAFAGFAQRPAAGGAVARLWGAAAGGRRTELARSDADAPCTGDSLARIAASHRLAHADEAVARTLALDYQLMSPHTNCVLVHRRADTDRAAGQAQLQRVSSMLAAGWGATSRVDRDIAPMMARCETSFFESSFGGSGWLAEAAGPYGDESRRAPGPLTLAELANVYGIHHGSGMPLDDIPGVFDPSEVHEEILIAIDALVQIGLEPATAWLVLACWVVARDPAILQRFPVFATAATTAGIDPSLLQRAQVLLQQRFGTQPLDAWPRSRMRRLRDALRRTRA